MSGQVVIIDEHKDRINKLGLLKGLLVATVFIMVVASGLVKTAHATTVSTTTTFDRTFYFNCTGFTDIEHYTGTETTRYFGDGSQQTKEHVDATFTNSVTGKSLSSTTNFVNTFGTDGSLTVTGATFRLNVPGRGQVLDTGRRVYSVDGEVVFDQGQSDGLPNLCQALAN